MIICKNINRKAVLFFVLACALGFTAYGQTNVVLLSTTVPAQWAPVPVGVKPGNTNVTISSGDTISLDGLANYAKLTIAGSAVLNAISNAAQGNVYQLQAGGATAPGIDSIVNNGVFGSTTGTNDGIELAIPSTTTYVKLLGTGTTAIGAIRPAGYNSNLTFELAQNATLNYDSVAYSAYPVVDSAVNDSITFNIDTGVTLGVINPEGQVQGIAPGNSAGGKYIYNINGTLDLSATKDTVNFEPLYASQNSTVTTNISGSLVLGSGFNTVYSNASGATPGAIVFNILNNGLVDATRTTYLNTGTNYFTTNGGVFKRLVGNSNTVFPVGAPGSGTYSPIVLNDKGIATNFSVSVKNQFDTPVPNSNKVVNKQWYLTPDSAGIANVTVTPGWLTADQAAGFNTAASIAVLNYNGSDWAATGASLTGSGTDKAPYYATAPGFTTFGAFTVANSAVNSEGISGLKVYPDPVSSLINVTFPAITNSGTISITTSAGQKVLSSGVGNGSALWTANLSDLAAGVYVLTLQNGDKKSSVKFIKL